MKSCPFCKSNNLSVDWVSAEYDSYGIVEIDLYAVSCFNCDCEGPVGDSKEDAIEKWDKRGEDE